MLCFRIVYGELFFFLVLKHVTYLKEREIGFQFLKRNNSFSMYMHNTLRSILGLKILVSNSKVINKVHKYWQKKTKFPVILKGKRFKTA